MHSSRNCCLGAEQTAPLQHPVCWQHRSTWLQGRAVEAHTAGGQWFTLLQGTGEYKRVQPTQRGEHILLPRQSWCIFLYPSQTPKKMMLPRHAAPSAGTHNQLDAAAARSPVLRWEDCDDHLLHLNASPSLFFHILKLKSTFFPTPASCARVFHPPQPRVATVILNVLTGFIDLPKTNRVISKYIH